jgi:transcription antitermination factor NusG
LNPEQNKNWYALYVASRQEKKVVNILNERSIDAYVPLVKSMRQWSDRKKMVEFPLMNGYVFVHTNPAENERVLQVSGVVNFVRCEGKVAIIRNDEIERLKQLIALGYQLDASGISREYKEGDKIKISSGPLKGIEGFIGRASDGKYLEVIIESIKQSIKVKLPEGILIPA